MATAFLMLAEIVGIATMFRTMPTVIPGIGIVLVVVAVFARTPETKIIIHLLVAGASAVAVGYAWDDYVLAYVFFEATAFWFFVRSLNGESGKIY